jgi:uncharacterized membrane protein (UPF0127 family)
VFSPHHPQRKFFFSLLLTSLFLLSFPSCKKEDTHPQPKTSIKAVNPFVVLNSETLFIEISDTKEERETGLMFREKLPYNQGMLFIFEYERKLEFWMKNTTLPLSIAYINRRRIIVDIQDMVPMTTTPYTSRFPAIYALEVNQGWFKEHKVRIGDSVTFHF